MPEDNSNQLNKQQLTLVIIILIIALIASIGGFVYLLTENDKNKKEIQSQKQKISTLTGEKEKIASEAATLKKELDSINNPTAETNYYQVKYNSYSQQQQKIAQTFTLDESKTISNLVLKSSFGVGSKLKITLRDFKSNKDIETGAVQASATYPTSSLDKEKEFIVSFGEDIILNTGRYVFIIEAFNRKTQAGIAYWAEDVDTTGKMYVYTRLIGGNGQILDNNHSWQPKNNQDIFYKLE